MAAASSPLATVQAHDRAVFSDAAPALLRNAIKPAVLSRSTFNSKAIGPLLAGALLSWRSFASSLDGVVYGVPG
jgi:hypothetical protein